MVRAREGECCGALRPVEADVCDIVWRIKEIDRGYFVMFNLESGRFEVHHEAQTGSTLACELPYEQLDERAVRYVRRTSAARIMRYLEELERENARLEGL